MQNYETLAITCSDHYSLSGRFYAAQGTQQALPVLIALQQVLLNSFTTILHHGLQNKAMPFWFLTFAALVSLCMNHLKSRKPVSCNGDN